MIVEFIQFLRPDGKRRFVQIELPVPDETIVAIKRCGMILAVEELTTGETQ